MKMTKRIQALFPLLAIFALTALIGCNQPSDDVGDTTAPVVVSTTPANGALDVAIVDEPISAVFSEGMDPESIVAASFTLYLGVNPITGSVAYDAATLTAVFTPATALLYSMEYTATVTTGVLDVAGNALAAAEVWSFTTIDDTTAPNVISTTPTNGATGVAVVNDPISAVFSEEMDPDSLNDVTFTLQDGVVSVAGSVMYDVAYWKAVFTPTANLVANKEYTATITTGVTDMAGNPMLLNKVWTFTTIDSLGVGPAPVNLGTAADFVVLAKTAISTVPASVITGDVGISPAAESFMTGFSQTKATGYSTSPQVTGFMYAADSTPPTPAKMTTAVSNMETAYTDAAGRPDPTGTNLYSGNLGGRSMAPGLYKFTTAVTIPSAFSLAGGPNDVWIFQIAGSLIMSNAVNITLLDGARAKNIFWQVAEKVEIGTTAHFEGNILCMTSITLKTGASMNGRALAQTLVALDQATITKPAQ